MTWYETVFELIDMRSFSNLWFWIALAVMWSTASHWIIGVPYDMIQRAQRRGGQAAEDVAQLVQINCNRILHIGEVSGLWLLGGVCAILTTLLILGFVYEIEFAQALSLLGVPLTFVGGVNLRTAMDIQAAALAGEGLYKRLKRHRVYVQLIGVASIFVTAMWGMYQNMQLGVLGG